MDTLTPSDDTEALAWADALAEGLPPMSATESAAVGLLAATLDARRAASRQQSATTPLGPATKPAAKVPTSRVA